MSYGLMFGAGSTGAPFGGDFGDAGIYAFYPNKQMTTGEGGIIATDRDDWAALFRSLRNHGRDAGSQSHKRLGYNYRLDDMSAALGLAQLRRLDELLAKRSAVASLYCRLLEDVDGVTPLAPPAAGHEMSWFVFIVRLAPEIDRDRLMERLEARGVSTRAYFPAIHLQPFYRERFGYRPGDFPNAENAARSLLALPFHSTLPDRDVEFVCEALAAEIATARVVAAL